MDLLARLQLTTPLLLDGGLATELERRGHDLSSRLWSARLLIDDPHAIQDVHQGWFAAGADCVITASYQAAFSNLLDEGLSRANVTRLLRQTIQLAKSARAAYRSECDDSRDLYVAASVGPYGATLADGSEYCGRYGLSRSELHDFHAARWEVLEATEPDVMACETIPDHDEAAVLIELARQSSRPVWLSLCCADDEHLCDGTRLAEIVSMAADCPGVVAVGVNCTAPRNVEGLITRIQESAPKKPIIVYPNSGETWDAQARAWRGDADATDFAKWALQWRDAGASVIGGCCRTTTEHVLAMRDVFESQERNVESRSR